MGTGEARETAGGMADAANGRQQRHAEIQKFLGLGDPIGDRFCP
jgi:predicted transcriptional regulator